MNKKITFVTDVHANLEALKAVLLDLKDKSIDSIYCLGNLIGLGYAPCETVDFAMNNNIINIQGNAEAYVIMGADMFPYLKRNNIERYNNAVWTKEQLKSGELDYINNSPISVEVDINNKKVGLCHFPLDVRYDFIGVWRYDGKNPEEFLKRNTLGDIERYKPELLEKVKIADKNPLLFGKRILDFDRAIYGHYHFEREHTLGNTLLNSLNGTGVAITDKAIYYILENGAKLIKYEVTYDYEKVFRETEEKDFPNKDTFKKVISWRKL